MEELTCDDWSALDLVAVDVTRYYEIGIARIKKPELLRAWGLGLGTWDLGWKTSVYEINDIL